MLSKSPTGKKVLKFVKKQGMVRPRDLKAKGLPPDYLWHLEKEGALEKLGRGLYTHPETPITEHLDLFEVHKRIPDGVFCLISALNFHDLTTQIPHQVWVAVGPGRYHPKIEYPPVNYIHYSGASLTEGIEVHRFGSMDIKVYSVAKTVADCFKFRNLVGLDVAMEALKDGLSKRLFTSDELYKYTKINRMTNVMRPYLEMYWA